MTGSLDTDIKIANDSVGSTVAFADTSPVVTTTANLDLRAFGLTVPFVDPMLDAPIDVDVNNFKQGDDTTEALIWFRVGRRAESTVRLGPGIDANSTTNNSSRLSRPPCTPKARWRPGTLPGRRWCPAGRRRSTNDRPGSSWTARRPSRWCQSRLVRRWRPVRSPL